MKQAANTRFAIKAWDEKPRSVGPDLPKLTRASIAKTYSGDLAGEAQVEYLMMYRSDGSAAFVGLERVVERIGGKAERRRLTLSSRAQQRESCPASSVKPPPPLGTAWSIRSC